MLFWSKDQISLKLNDVWDWYRGNVEGPVRSKDHLVTVSKEQYLVGITETYQKFLKNIDLSNHIDVEEFNINSKITSLATVNLTYPFTYLFNFNKNDSMVLRATQHIPKIEKEKLEDYLEKCGRRTI